MTEPEVLEDCSLPMEAGSAFAMVFSVLVMAAGAALWAAVDRVDAIADTTGWQVGGTALAVVAAVPVHEGLHALGFLLGGAPIAALHFGIDRKTLSPYAGCRVPLRARPYRIALLLPMVVLGLLPLLGGLAAHHGPAFMFGIVMTALAGGDVVGLWAMRRAASGAWVLDHPARIGCRIVALVPPVS